MRDLAVPNPYNFYRLFTILNRRSFVNKFPQPIHEIIESMDWPEGVLRRHMTVAKGGDFVDVGANLGVYVKHLANSSRLVHAIEPAQETYLRLLHNTMHLKNVRYYNLALGDKAAKRRLNLHHDSGRNSLLAKHSDFYSTQEVEVKCLDALMSGNDFVNLLKIDAEGFELEILEGAHLTIERCRPRVIVEVHESFHSPRDIADYLIKRDYSTNLIRMKRRVGPQCWVVGNPYQAINKPMLMA